MKIVVIGGTGLIGSKTVQILRSKGHEALAASPSTGVNAVTGEGLASAFAGTDVVIDVSNSPSFEDKPVMEFFEKSNRNIIAAEIAAGVKHHVAVSVVGTDRLLESGYFRAKLVQENLIKSSPIPYTIVRATQFFEFVNAIVQSSADAESVRLTSAFLQPIAAADVSAAVADVALAAPVNGTIEIAGPEAIRLDEIGRQFLAAKGDSRPVTTDDKAGYFGIELKPHSLTPADGARLSTTRFGDWLKQPTPQK